MLGYSLSLPVWRGGRQTVQKVLEAWFAVCLREHEDLFTHTRRLTTHAKETQLLNQKRTVMWKLYIKQMTQLKLHKCLHLWIQIFSLQGINLPQTIQVEKWQRGAITVPSHIFGSCWCWTGH